MFDKTTIKYISNICTCLNNCIIIVAMNSKPHSFLTTRQLNPSYFSLIRFGGTPLFSYNT